MNLIQKSMQLNKHVIPIFNLFENFIIKTLFILIKYFIVFNIKNGSKRQRTAWFLFASIEVHSTPNNARLFSAIRMTATVDWLETLFKNSIHHECIRTIPISVADLDHMSINGSASKIR